MDQQKLFALIYTLNPLNFSILENYSINISTKLYYDCVSNCQIQ